MITWIAKLCVLCSMSALMQMTLPEGGGRDGVRMICGLLMLHMTCESASELLLCLSDSRDIMEMFEYLVR